MSTEKTAQSVSAFIVEERSAADKGMCHRAPDTNITTQQDHTSTHGSTHAPAQFAESISSNQ